MTTTYINHATVAAPRNGTTSHTVGTDGTGGTVVDGAGFSATSGSLLICVCYGSVTSTTPSGWTLPTNGSAINNGGLYIWTITAASGNNSFSTTHNGSNYPVIFDFYEFASGSTFFGCASATNVASGSSTPTLSSITGTTWIAGVAGRNANLGTNTYTWNTGTEEVDTSVASSGTDGYSYSLTYNTDQAVSSAAYTATYTGGSPNLERLEFAVSAVAGGGGGGSNPTEGEPVFPLFRRAFDIPAVLETRFGPGGARFFYPGTSGGLGALWKNNCEGQANGTVLTTSNSTDPQGMALNFLSNNVNILFDTTDSVSGQTSLLVTPESGGVTPQIFGWTHPAVNNIFGEIFWQFVTWPTQAIQIVQVRGSGNNFNIQILTTNRISVSAGGSSVWAPTDTYSANTWYRLAWQVEQTSANARWAVQSYNVDGSLVAQDNGIQAAGTGSSQFTTTRFGYLTVPAAQTALLRFDQPRIYIGSYEQLPTPVMDPRVVATGFEVGWGAMPF